MGGQQVGGNERKQEGEKEGKEEYSNKAQLQM